MATLSEEVRRFIVQSLACFRSPSEVAALVEEEFGVRVERMHVRRYNPLQCSDVGKKWKAVFAVTRAAFLKDTAASGIANASFRLRELDDTYRKLKAKGNFALARDYLETAAKDAGGLFTNRRESVDLNVDLSTLTDTQLERLAGGEDVRKVLGEK